MENQNKPSTKRLIKQALILAAIIFLTTLRLLTVMVSIEFMRVIAGPTLYYVSAGIYELFFERTQLVDSYSDDEAYHLKGSQIGGTIGFCSVSGKLYLYKGKKKISEYHFFVANDGADAREDNFTVTWNDDNVLVLVRGEEQHDEEIYMYFDGTVERNELEENTYIKR